MNIRDRDCIVEMLEQLHLLGLFIAHLRHWLKRDGAKISSIVAEFAVAMDRFTAAVDEFEELAELMIDEARANASDPADFTSDETRRLGQLHHSMNLFSQFMYRMADSIRPNMQVKVADDTDPLFDFEIEAKIDYQLRDSDPEYDEDSDNYMSRRSESLGNVCMKDPLTEDWRYNLTPEPFMSEPLSWLLHDLIEHGYGPCAPRISPRDCLRIGTVSLDIQVWWQYVFDLDSGQWIKRWRQPYCVPEFAPSQR